MKWLHCVVFVYDITLLMGHGARPGVARCSPQWRQADCGENTGTNNEKEWSFYKVGHLMFYSISIETRNLSLFLALYKQALYIYFILYTPLKRMLSVINNTVIVISLKVFFAMFTFITGYFLTGKHSNSIKIVHIMAHFFVYCQSRVDEIGQLMNT